VGSGSKRRTDVPSHEPPFQIPGRVPEHPLLTAGDDEGFRDASLLEGVEILANLAGEVEDILN
jgi:hypothetical protein